MRVGETVLVVGLLTLALMQGCGSGSNSTSQTPTITAVNVSPQSPMIAAGQQQVFAAQVSGTGAFSTAVNWSVNDVPGGSATVGTISPSGNYLAPSSFNAPFTATIKAVSTADSSKSGTSQASIVTGLVSNVTIDPQAPNVGAGSSQSFTATVQGAGNVNPNVTWKVNSLVGGNSTVGTIGTGMSTFYVAPSVIPSPATVTITATSVQDATKSGTASATVVAPALGIISVSVNPDNVNMPASQTQTFTPTVIGVGNFNPAVTWTVGPAGITLSSYGSISGSGIYTPPNNLTMPTPVNITVTSVADPSKTATASVQIFPTPVLTSLTPNPVQPGQVLDIEGTNLQNVVSIQFTGPNNLTLNVPSFSAGVQVPFSTVSGPVTVTTQLPGFAPVVTNSLQLTRISALRIRAANRDLAAGESTTFAYRILGTASAQSIQWTADVGTIDRSGNYQAPGSVTSDAFATIQGCIASTQICQSEILGLHPFRITPYPAAVALGGSLQMQSTLGGTTWNALSGEGTLAPGGLFTAGTKIADAGGIPISATANGVTEKATVGVTGGFPGVVSEVSDYVDYTLPLPVGTANSQIAVSGNHMYTLATGNYAGPYEATYFWIDVYDISDPIHPIWIDAIECANEAPLFTYGNYLYQIGQITLGGSNGIAVFDISGVKPVLVAEKFFAPQPANPGYNGFNYFGGIVYSANGYSDSHDQVMISKLDLRNGSIAETDFSLPIPNGAGPSSTVGSEPVGTDTRLFVVNAVNASTTSESFEVDSFDLTTTSPSLLQTQPYTPDYFGTWFEGSMMVAGGDAIFDISSGLPVRASTLPLEAVGQVLGFNGKQLLTAPLQSGLQVTDLSDLTQPKLSGVLFDPRSASSAATWSGQYVITGSGDLRVFEGTVAGGATLKASPVQAFAAAAAFDQLIYQSHLLVATETDQNAFVSVVDLSTNPISEVSEFDTGSANPIALQAAANTMYVGTDQSLLVVDISNFASPSQVSSIPGAVSAVATVGNYLYCGTADGHLIVYDISQPGSPTQVASLMLPVAAIVIRASNTLLFVADDASGLLTYSLANPAAPALLSQFQPAMAVSDLAIDGNLVLLTTFDQGLVIANLSNPVQPVQIGQAIIPTFAFTSASATADGITLANKIAYVGTWEDSGNVFGFDYSTPAHPRLVAAIPIGGVVCSFVLTLQNDGTDLFEGGAVSGYPFLDLDLSQPRNVINDYPIFATAIGSGPVDACDDEKQASSRQAKFSNYSSMRARMRNRKGLLQRQTSRPMPNLGK
jgi:hypothetical protein